MADQVIQLMFIHHLHYTPVKLVSMGLGFNIAGSRCDLVAANFFHMFWNCPGLSSFWKDLFNLFEHKLKLPIPQILEVGLLGVRKEFVLRLYYIYCFSMLKMILLHWKDTAPLTAHAFFCNVHGDLHKFKMIYKSRKCPNTLTKIPKYGNHNWMSLMLFGEMSYHYSLINQVLPPDDNQYGTHKGLLLFLFCTVLF